MKTLTGIAVVALAMGVSSAKAQDSDELAEQLSECYKIESSLARLDCYDNLSRGIEGRDSATVVSKSAMRSEPETAQVEEPRASGDNFGREHRRETEDSSGRRYVEITEAWQNPRGLWRFRLSSGAEWHQTQSERFVYDPEVSYYIESGALNSFRLSHDDTNRSIRIRRID